MKISDLMARDVVTCGVDDTLETAANLFWSRDCGAIPVVDAGGRLAGIVTDRDACLGAFFAGRSLREVPLATTMARTVRTCRADDDLDVALRRMKEHRVRRLPVVDADGCVVGMVGLADLASAALSGGAARGRGIGADELAGLVAAVTSVSGAAAPIEAAVEIAPARNPAKPPAAKAASSAAGRNRKTAPKNAARKSGGKPRASKDS
jgi:CBS domain-containing protein